MSEDNLGLGSINLSGYIDVPENAGTDVHNSRQLNLPKISESIQRRKTGSSGARNSSKKEETTCDEGLVSVKLGKVNHSSSLTKGGSILEKSPSRL